MSAVLPILQPHHSRTFPTRASQQGGFPDPYSVCANCLSGGCCSSEGPIALTAFDVLRLAAFLDLSPAEFLLAFTQDRFPGDDRFSVLIADPGSSVVTFLRRRANYPTSPCIFLKYVREVDGTRRRICSIHAGRPLACREYYFDTCGKRWTGELAVQQAEGLELVRDGRIDRRTADARCRELEPVVEGDSLSKKWQYAFWSEMRRATDVHAANNEGAASYSIAEFQDPIDEKLNRLLSTRQLRFEEKYGPTPHSEQLHPYTAGLAFKQSDERERLLRIVRTPPAGSLYGGQDYPHFLGLRTLMPGTRMPQQFDLFPEPAATDDQCAAAIIRGWNFLLGVAGHAAQTGGLEEVLPDGSVYYALRDALEPFTKTMQQQIAGAACLEPVKTWLEAAAPRWRPARRHVALDRWASTAALRRKQLPAIFEALHVEAAHRGLTSRRQARAAALAVRWSRHVEGIDAWSNEWLLRWPMVCARLGLASLATAGFARGINYLLRSQGGDGSWGIDLETRDPAWWQDFYLVNAIGATAAAMEGLVAARLQAPAPESRRACSSGTA
jgi:Fe-S-cluster containining protein